LYEIRKFEFAISGVASDVITISGTNYNVFVLLLNLRGNADFLLRTSACY